MPMYTYRCENGHEFEYQQRMTEAPLNECLTCEATVRRVVNSVGVVFKGSGFYITDNSRGGSASRTANGTTKTEEGESKSESSPPAETKTAEPTPAAPAT